MAMFHVIFSIHHLTAYLAQFPLKCLSRNATYESDRNLAFLRFQRNVSLQTDVSFLLAQSWNRFPCKPQRLSSTFTLNIDTNPTARLQVVTLTETDGTRASRREERHSEKKDAWAGEGFPLWSRSTGGKQKLGCLTLKCPLLHTAVKNSVWTSGAQLNITTQAFRSSKGRITMTTSEHLCENGFLRKRVRRHFYCCAPDSEKRPWETTQFMTQKQRTWKKFRWQAVKLWMCVLKSSTSSEAVHTWGIALSMM